MATPPQPRKHSVLPIAAAAAAVGAGLGILFAPKKGKELRQDISKAASDTTDQVRDTFEDARRGLMSEYRELRDDLDKSIAKATDAGEMTKDKFDVAVDKVVARAARAKKWTKDVVEKYAADLKKEFKDA